MAEKLVGKNVRDTTLGGVITIDTNNDNVGIGKSPYSFVKLDVESSTQICLNLYRTTTNVSSDCIKLSSDVGGTETNTYLVEADGDNFNVNNSYGAISDARLKENIVDANSQWEDMKNIKYRNFNFIGNDDTNIGVVAQELEKVSPYLVKEKDDDMKTKRVKTSVLYMKGMKALQEALLRIEELEKKVNK